MNSSSDTKSKSRQLKYLRGGGGGIICQKTGIIFRVGEFKTTPSILQCFKCQGFGHKAPNCTKNQKCVVRGEAHSHKICPNKDQRKPKCANCRGPHVAITGAVLHIRTKLSGSTWSKNKFLTPPYLDKLHLHPQHHI